jgi:hypothetical protein
VTDMTLLRVESEEGKEDGKKDNEEEDQNT